MVVMVEEVVVKVIIDLEYRIPGNVLELTSQGSVHEKTRQTVYC